LTGTYHAFGCAEYAARHLADAQFHMDHRYRLDLIPAATLRTLVRKGPCGRVAVQVRRLVANQEPVRRCNDRFVLL